MRAFRLFVAAPLVVVALGCSSEAAPPPRRPLSADVVMPEPEPQPKQAIARAVVDKAIKAGLGHFLAYVDVEAQVDNGKFVGWKVIELRGPKGTWDGVDLRVGDVVVRVNGFKVERDYEADKAFKSLAVASEIRVTLLREGQPAELRLAIVAEGEMPPDTAGVIKEVPEK